MAAQRRLWAGGLRYSAGALGVLVLLALLAPWISPADPDRIDVLHRFVAPGPHQWLGTDELGRDVLSRMLVGARVSLGVGLVAALGSTAIGAFLGALAGYFGGRLDGLLMRGADVLMCIPKIYLVLTLIVVLGPGIGNVVLVIVATEWTGMARLVRSEVLSLRDRDFVTAARASGAGPLRVLLRHVMPDSIRMAPATPKVSAT